MADEEKLSAQFKAAGLVDGTKAEKLDPANIDWSNLNGSLPMEELLKYPRLIPVSFEGTIGWVCAPTSDTREQVEEKLNSANPALTCIPPEMAKADHWDVIEQHSDKPGEEHYCSPGFCHHSTPEHPRQHWLFMSHQHWLLDQMAHILGVDLSEAMTKKPN